MTDISKNVKDLIVTLLGFLVGCYFVHMGHAIAGAVIVGSAFGYGIKNGIANNKKNKLVSATN